MTLTIKGIEFFICLENVFGTFLSNVQDAFFTVILFQLSLTL